MKIRIDAAAPSATTAAARIERGNGIARAAPNPRRRAITSPVRRAARTRSIIAAIATGKGRGNAIGRR